MRKLIERGEMEAKLGAERGEMYSRRESVRVFGLDEKAGEDVEDLVMEVGKKVGVPFSRRDIAACHRVGARKDGRPRQIIAKFVNRKDKEEFVRCARRRAKELESLRGKVYANEDLTEMRQRMCGLARKSEKVKSVVTNNGVILCYLKKVREDGRNEMRRVERPEDLADLLELPVDVILKRIGLVNE